MTTKPVSIKNAGGNPAVAYRKPSNVSQEICGTSRAAWRQPVSYG